MTLNKQYLAAITLSLSALLGFAQTAQAQDACSCTCILDDNNNPVTSWACSGWVTAPNACPTDEAGLAAICPAPEVVETAPEVGQTEPVTPPEVVAGTPSEENVSCRYRRVYDPAAGEFKRKKVCRMRMTEEEREAKRERIRERLAALRARHAERLARVRARAEDRMSRLRAKHRGHNDDDGEETSDD